MKVMKTSTVAAINELHRCVTVTIVHSMTARNGSRPNFCYGLMWFIVVDERAMSELNGPRYKTIFALGEIL